MSVKTIGKVQNVSLWVLQISLAFWAIAGGYYMVNHYEFLATAWALKALPRVVWVMLGSFEIVCGAGLVIPMFIKKPKLTAMAAMGLTMTSLVGLALYSSFSGFPGSLWGLIPALFTGLIAYKRSR